MPLWKLVGRPRILERDISHRALKLKPHRRIAVFAIRILVMLLATCACAMEAVATAETLPDTPTAQSQQTPQPSPGTAAQTAPPPQPPADKTAVVTTEEQRKKAAEQLKMEEHQRILRVAPNFNTIESSEAVPLTPEQKFHLMYKSTTDPFIFITAGLIAGIGQARDSFQGYGQGAGGYFKRFGASYADTADGNLWGNAILPVMLHEDPRYFRLGHGTIKRRLTYAAETVVICPRDNGKWGPNYSNVGGNLIAGGISNLYYPSTDRGVGLTFQNAATVTAEGAIGAAFLEFWPDLSHRFLHKRSSSAQHSAPLGNQVQ